MKDFVRERNAAIVEFVTTGNAEKVRAYCKRYGVPMPKSKKAFAAGIYKAAQAGTSIPEDVRVLAMQKCLALGFNPFMRPAGLDDESEGSGTA